VRRLIDWMAVNKLNVLHWHLVDDQGWRLEIKKYPRLTQVSAWRTPATAPGAPPLPRVGGFYTQNQVRAIVAYSAAHNITIVPEIEMPGHALAAIRAYPQLGTGAPFPPGVESDWGIFPWLYNTDEGTFGFIDDVLTEVMALFPSRYIHVGGDEAVKDQWKASPKIQSQMKALGITSEDALQGWFVSRIGKFLAAHGLGRDSAGRHAGKRCDHIVAWSRRGDRCGEVWPRFGAQPSADALLRQSAGVQHARAAGAR
jgi:hexosaminidase